MSSPHEHYWERCVRTHTHAVFVREREGKERGREKGGRKRGGGGGREGGERGARG